MPNSLIHETSPYLLQHAHNPVNWRAWNDETLAMAEKENRMLLISIGYAACHWCHVMEHESFEDEEVARIMNEHYICVKADREERPDVDQVYMDAAYLISGNGGWPLHALAMPDGKPFFAGTYFPREQWIRLLQYFADLYQNERGKLEEQASSLSRGIRSMEPIPVDGAAVVTPEDAREMYTALEKQLDIQNGGIRGNLKFPMPSIWEFLLGFEQAAGKREALSATGLTLHHMALGGIYDQVGGGFSRYATDSRWHVPHFEKMLYDNAQLVSLYSHAFQVTGNPLYQRIVYETLEFINRELTSPEGGFYSSLDADSQGEEGKFYVWEEQEIRDVLGGDAESYLEHYSITTAGNWEHGKNIPDELFGKKEDPAGEVGRGAGRGPSWSVLNKKLLARRQQRIRPATDDKILTCWNALMAKGLIAASQAFNDGDLFSSAKKNLDFLLENVYRRDHSLLRSYKNGRASIPAFLDDYAFLISGLIDFYQASFDEKYLYTAKDLTGYVISHFFNRESGMFFYTDQAHAALIARKSETTDQVIPSSNSEMSRNLLQLSLYFDDRSYGDIAARMTRQIREDALKNPAYYSNWGLALLWQAYPVFEIAIAGSQWEEKLRQFRKHFIPNAVFCGGSGGTLPLLRDKDVPGKTLIYVCRNKTCGLPVTETDEALKQMG